MDLALNNLQRLICHKTKQTKPNRDVRMDRIGKNLRLLKCSHAEATVRAVLCENSLFFCFVQPDSKSYQVYIIFRTPTQSSWSLISLTRCNQTGLLFSTLPTKYTQHFVLGNTCVPFTLGNRFISFYDTHTIYADFRWGFCQLFTLGNRCKLCYITHTTHATCHGNLPVDI